MMGFKLLFQCACLLLALAQACQAAASPKPVIVFHFDGGQPFSYVNDLMRISPDGTVELNTLASFPYEFKQNTMGRFKAATGTAAYESLHNEVLAFFKSKPSKEPIADDGVIGAVSFEHKEAAFGHVWNLGSSLKTKSLEQYFYKIKNSVLSSPVSAIKLDCKLAANSVNCSILNVGTEPTKTIDPADMPYSIFCLDITGIKKPMNPGAEYDPKKMSPNKIIIKPNERFRFKIENTVSCHERILMRTSDMLINSAYGDSLLGELISNQL